VSTVLAGAAGSARAWRLIQSRAKDAAPNPISTARRRQSEVKLTSRGHCSIHVIGPKADLPDALRNVFIREG
jgi:hypothetical protein